MSVPRVACRVSGARSLRMYSGRQRPRARDSPMYPRYDDLRPLLSTTGMVKFCGRGGNAGRPLLGLDVAPTNFGVAVSDPSRTFATPLCKVLRQDEAKRKVCPLKVAAKLQGLIDANGACGMVVGWPLEKSGRVGPQCLMVLQFLHQIRLKGKIFIPVTLLDERLTSVAARDLLDNSGVSKHWVRAAEDETAAMVVLQGFLESAEAYEGGLSTLEHH
ncbi:unnamed protein product [Discosporangium mesarthrocarpum]